MSDTARTDPIPPVLLVGCGRMGGAMLAGWREAGLMPSVAVDPAPEAARHAGPDLTVVATVAEIPAGFRPGSLVLAVKPQLADAILPSFAVYGRDTLVLSIMAGRTTQGIARLVGDAAIVRAMPNTPAAIRKGITVACPTPRVSAEQRELADRLLRAIGQVSWINDEGLLDAVTAVSGSGPAYVFLLAELMEQAGIQQGLPAELARTLARATVAGSGALIAASPEPASRLREAVTSPGGTTAAALEVLMDAAAWPQSLTRAIGAATERSKALAG